MPGGRASLSLSAVLVAATPAALGQQKTTVKGACTLATPSYSTSAPDIFNDQQEQDLGDALAEWIEPKINLVSGPDNDELQQIGDRLLKSAPPTDIQYRFRLYDSGEVNAFSLAGGRVYVSRKLVAAARNENELAGVLAHEMGHILTRQTAIEMTRAFKTTLGVVRAC